MTKSFVGVAVMQLQEKGKLKLNDNASLYLSDLPSEWKNLTIKQLLSHTSGLPEIEVGTSLVSPIGFDASWNLVKKLPMLTKPGTQFNYTSTNYVLLGKILNKVSGINFTDFIDRYQLSKIGMERTKSAGFKHFQGVIPHQARGYTYYFGNELTTIQYELSPMLRTSAGMSSNVQEIARWVIALQNGKLLDLPKTIDIMWTPAVLESGKTKGFSRLVNGYALGWQVIGRAEHPVVVSMGGDRSALFINPEDNLAIVVMTNLMGAKPEEFIDEIANFYIADMVAINGITLPKNKLLEYTGRYKFKEFSVDVTLSGDRLTLLASGDNQQPFNIYAISETEFFAKVVDAKFSLKKTPKMNRQHFYVRQGENVLRGEKLP